MISAKQYGPWAFIAGGSEGVAASFAHKLATAGINLVLVARRPEPLQKLSDDVRAISNVEIRTLVLDLKRSDMLDLIREITDDIEVGLLIFNAGNLDSMMGSFLDRSVAEALSVVQLTTIAQTTLVHHFASLMAARGRGGIILVGSLSGAAGMPDNATYCAAKAYSQIFAEALWCELRPRGIDVLALVPGVIDTPARTHSKIPGVPGMPVLTSDEVAQQALDHLPDGGPVCVPPSYEQIFQSMRSAPRRQIAERMSGAVIRPQQKTT